MCLCVCVSVVFFCEAVMRFMGDAPSRSTEQEVVSTFLKVNTHSFFFSATVFVFNSLLIFMCLFLCVCVCVCVCVRVCACLHVCVWCVVVPSAHRRVHLDEG